MALFWFYGLFYGALGLGTLAHRHKTIAPLIMRLTILFLETPIFIYSFWILDLNQIKEYAPIPIIAALLVLIILSLSRWWAKQLHFQSPISQGSFVLSAGFSNIGTTGGAFICYLLFGLPGLALAYLFLLPYPFLIFTLGFSIAKKYASKDQLTFKDYMSNIFSNVFSIVPLLAILLGLLLNLAGLSPTTMLNTFIDSLIKIDLAIMCFAIGMTIEIHKIMSYWRSLFSMSAIKFILTPLIAVSLTLIAYGSLSSLSAKIIIIQAAMPPAIYAVITANLYKLDRELINALWLVNTLILIPIVALLFFLFT